MKKEIILLIICLLISTGCSKKEHIHINKPNNTTITNSTTTSTSTSKTKKTHTTKKQTKPTKTSKTKKTTSTTSSRTFTSTTTSTTTSKKIYSTTFTGHSFIYGKTNCEEYNSCKPLIYVEIRTSNGYTKPYKFWIYLYDEFDNLLAKKEDTYDNYLYYEDYKPGKYKMTFIQEDTRGIRKTGSQTAILK